MHPVAANYFGGWSRRDPEAIAAAFAPEGTFSDPEGTRPASAVASHATRLFNRFPGLTFELRDTAPSGDGVVARWTMRLGERTVNAADFLAMADGLVASVERYYDPTELAGPQSGTAVRVGSGSRALPGAFGITWQEAASEGDREYVRGVSERILKELPDTPGFIGAVAATIGNRFLTVSAWEQPNDPFALIRDGSHRFAAVQFFGPDVYSAGWTGVWTPARLHNRWVRCSSCRKMANGDRCACGEALPEAPPYW